MDLATIDLCGTPWGILLPAALGGVYVVTVLKAWATGKPVSHPVSPPILFHILPAAVAYWATDGLRHITSVNTKMLVKHPEVPVAHVLAVLGCLHLTELVFLGAKHLHHMFSELRDGQHRAQHGPTLVDNPPHAPQAAALPGNHVHEPADWGGAPHAQAAEPASTAAAVIAQGDARHGGQAQHRHRHRHHQPQTQTGTRTPVAAARGPAPQVAATPLTRGAQAARAAQTTPVSANTRARASAIEAASPGSSGLGASPAAPFGFVDEHQLAVEAAQQARKEGFAKHLPAVREVMSRDPVRPLFSAGFMAGLFEGAGYKHPAKSLETEVARGTIRTKIVNNKEVFELAP
ncbi:hypothetical protein JKP88DRAFT_318515 [Tribonema minus]|uniref:Uncharacterized protein n=1 Tax=Tribonema minus TaxID=303371 RepID=A0A835YW90_9STRA|nr:hypothetical protein JKP88DRAFT_318515 [Tribonema minus]